MHPISIKDLRLNLSKVASAAARGESFVVLRRSAPCFKIVPYSNPTSVYDNIPEVDEEEENEERWETVLDLTEGGTKDGMPIEQFSEILDKVIAEEDGR